MDVAMVKGDLRRYGVQKGHIKYSNLHYHSLLWGTSLINKFFLHQSHHIFYCLVMNLSYQTPFKEM
jgi:hypothetical protein